MGEKDGFRQTEIHFLQEQNSQVINALEKVEREREEAKKIAAEFEQKEASLQAEYQRVKLKIVAITTELQQQRTEIHSKEEHIRVLGDQNKQLLDLLEQTENKVRTTQESSTALDFEIKRLKLIEDDFDRVKEKAEAEVSAAKRDVLKLLEEVRNTREFNEQLRTEAANFEAQTSVDLEALEQALSVVKAKNVDYIQQIQAQEVKAQQYQQSISTLNVEAAELEEGIVTMKGQMEGEEEERQKFARNAGDQQQRLEGMEAQVDALRKALSSAERANEGLQEDNRQSSEKFREMADKVYALMDALRLNQVDLKKHEAENMTTEKKCGGIEKQVANLNTKIETEIEAAQVAEQAQRDAEAQANMLKKQNKQMEEAIALAQKAQAACERKAADVQQQVTSLQTQNAYLASRVDTMEDEKSDFRAELKRGSDRLSELVRANSKLQASIDQLDTEHSRLKADRDQLRAQLEYIKREDVLDESGRQRPILIQSNQSSLLERLQINEFLYEAQQSKTPIPLVVEKIAQVLELLHSGQSQADQYLADVSKSNTLVAALRSKNMKLFEQVQEYEQFKSRSLIRFVGNQLEADSTSMIFLDGLHMVEREVQEVHNLLRQYEVLERVNTIVLSDNGLTDDLVNLLLQIIFSVPYMKRFDLRRNALSGEAIKRLQTQCQNIQGVTACIWTKDNSIAIRSGNQLRLTIELAEQGAAQSKPDTDDFLVSDFSVDAADSHLQSKAGLQAPVPVGMGGPGDVSNLGKHSSRSASDSTLPKIKGQPRQKGGPGSKAGKGKMAKPGTVIEERHADPKVVDKWQAGNFPRQQIAVPQEGRRPGSGRKK
jgi:myosin protein heavy chain